jgi:hypothetical protein
MRRNPLAASAARVAAGVALVLAIAAVAAGFDEGTTWSLGDFVAAALVLAVIGAAFEVALRRAGNLALAAGLGVLGALAAVIDEPPELSARLGPLPEGVRLLTRAERRRLAQRFDRLRDALRPNGCSG